jgi:ferrous iron transport protein B
MDSKKINIALFGNPNCGKSSIFNHLTGLNQKIGNFAGVTVDKKVGYYQESHHTVSVIDLPGTYSLYPKSVDEQVVLDFLYNKTDKNYPDLALVVVDASNIKRNLLLLTQLKDWSIPIVLVLNMVDVAQKIGIEIDTRLLSKKLGVAVVSLNGRTGEGIEQLKAQVFSYTHSNQANGFYNTKQVDTSFLKSIQEKFELANSYQALLLAHQYRKHFTVFSKQDKSEIEKIVKTHQFQSATLQIQETAERYALIDAILKECISEKDANKQLFYKLDKLFLHPIGGYLVFLLILLLVFQAIFSWASIPMDWIDNSIAQFNQYLKSILPTSLLSRLLTEGIIAGLGGILIFIPQIAILFLFITILEESGYMTRVMVIMDQLMRRFGMNGRSVVPLISGVACAVPAIIATRNIDDWKSRLITIMVTPLMSCSARIPVFTILIALVIPNTYLWGIINLQGLVLMGLYLLGALSAVLVGAVLSKLIRSNQTSFFILELPPYKMPRWKNVAITIYEKVKTFVFEAGKVIIAIAILLWGLSNFGPSNAIEVATKKVLENKTNIQDSSIIHTQIAVAQLEASYAGHFGKMIEPIISPLGFDWKIGVALLSSFAAREVFIGTMSTIYSVGNDQAESVMKKMQEEINPKTGAKMYTLPLGMSLLVFYVFAMQCMSTLAVVYRETKSWKWPAIQLIYMTTLAYASSYLVFNVLS